MQVATTKNLQKSALPKAQNFDKDSYGDLQLSFVPDELSFMPDELSHCSTPASQIQEKDCENLKKELCEQPRQIIANALSKVASEENISLSNTEFLSINSDKIVK